jgi:prepilin-type N-terminal cleavage/methylation domain-containing protein
MNRFKKGFTLLELVVTIGILGIMVYAVFTSLTTTNSRQTLDKNALGLAELLEQARVLTVDSKNSSQYGVHLATTSATLFSGTTYSSASSSNQIYSLGTTISISSISVGGGSDVIFNRITGTTNNSGTVTLSSTKLSGVTKVITIYKTGVVEKN